MSTPRKSILKSLLYVLRNPTRVIPDGHEDLTRRQAVIDLDKYDYAANIAVAPQSSSDPYQITINTIGGLTPVNADSFVKHQRSTIELATWWRQQSNRANVIHALTMDQLIVAYIIGLTGTFEGIAVAYIGIDIDPFQQEDSPADGSDRWVNAFTHTLEIQHGYTMPDHRVAVGVDGP